MRVADRRSLALLTFRVLPCRHCLAKNAFAFLIVGSLLCVALPGDVDDDDSRTERGALGNPLAPPPLRPCAAVLAAAAGGGGIVIGRIAGLHGGPATTRLGVHQLATEGAEAEGVEEGACADLAVVGGGGGLAGGGSGAAWLGALVEEEDLGAVDDVGLDAGDVEDVLHLRHPNHVVVGRTPYLDDSVGLVSVGAAVVAEGRGGGRAVEAEHVALVPRRRRVRPARQEEARRQQRLQPLRQPRRPCCALRHQ
jgi:hypothetical protein